MADIDTDLDSIADERETASLGSPLKDAIADLGREEDHGSEQDDTETEVEETEDLDVEEENEEEESSEATEETEEPSEEESEETEDEKADKPKGKAPKLVSLDIPMPNADGSKGPRGTGKITLEGLPQEAADAVRHYIKQANQLPLIEEQLTVAQEGAQIADFVERDPFSAMVLIEKARPEAAEEFVKSYLAMNPGKIAQITTELELDEMTEREQKLAAKDARRSAEERAKSSYQDHAGKYQTQKQADKLLLTVQDLATTANVPEDEMEEFMFLASRRVAKLYQQNPRISNREVVAALQPVVAKYAKTVTPTSSPKKSPKNPGKDFTVKVQRSKKFSVVGSGKGQMKPAGAMGKLPKGTTVQQAIRMVRAGKI